MLVCVCVCVCACVCVCVCVCVCACVCVCVPVFVAANCMDRHLALRADQTALLWEADEPGEGYGVRFTESDRHTTQQ